MRVAVDATPLTLTSGGLARYTSELTRALKTCFPEDQYYLLSPPGGGCLAQTGLWDAFGQISTVTLL